MSIRTGNRRRWWTRAPIGVLWRAARQHVDRSCRDNVSEYALLSSWSGLVGAALWPLYGLFCLGALHLREDMPWRTALCLGYLATWWCARSGKAPKAVRWAWLSLSVAGLGWLPWHLYFLNDAHPYWQMSVVFFALTFGVAVRGIDLLLAIPATALWVVLDHGREMGSREHSLLAVVATTLWVVVSGEHLLRAARRRIGEQTRQLQLQNERLRSLDRTKDAFTTNIAHDLRTPLAVALSLVEDMGRSDLPQVARNRVDSLRETLRQMRRQSEELLDFQRFQLGVARLDRRELEAGGWLSGFEEGLASMARAHGLTFQVVLPKDELRVSIDPQRLETALFNLVSNAFKFTPPGGHVEVHLRRRGANGVVVAVLDDGEGIPPGALRKIFERFQQVDRGPGTYTAGVGIGLALVKDVAEAHGGHVTVQSTLGLGSLFEIVLPDVLVQARPQPLELTPLPATQGRFPAERPPSAGRLAVVAEDEQLLRQVLHDVLERVAKVATARDGREALRLVHELNPDILVTDFHMPGMDGLQLLAALRADPATRELPVVLLSGDPLSLRSRLADEPTLAVMGKPFEQAELVATVRSLLEGSPVGQVA